MIIFVPQDEKFDKTELAILAAGARPLQLKLEIAI